MRATRTRAILAAAAVVVTGAVGTTMASGDVVTERGGLFATLTGENGGKYDGGTPNQGDLDGRFVPPPSSEALPSRGRICFGITVVKIDEPAAAHIRAAAAGSNGAMVKYPLTPPSSGNPGAYVGCLTGVNEMLLKDVHRIRRTTTWTSTPGRSRPGRCAASSPTRP